MGAPVYYHYPDNLSFFFWWIFQQLYLIIAYRIEGAIRDFRGFEATLLEHVFFQLHLVPNKLCKWQK